MGHSHLEVRGQLRGLAFRGGESRRDCSRRDCCRDLSVSMLNTSGVTCLHSIHALHCVLCYIACYIVCYIVCYILCYILCYKVLGCGDASLVNYM